MRISTGNSFEDRQRERDARRASEAQRKRNSEAYRLTLKKNCSPEIWKALREKKLNSNFSQKVQPEACQL